MAHYRPMTLDDYAKVYALWASCEGIGLSASDEPNAIASYLVRNAGLSWVAEEAEVIVGAILAGHDGRRGYLHHLAVSKDYRGQGIGSKLVALALEGLSREGMDRTHLYTFTTNETGQAFWKSMGATYRHDIGLMTFMDGKGRPR